MRLNHIDIAVNDVSAARAFLETYFDLHCITERGTVAIMRDDADVIVALSNFGHAKEVTYPKGFSLQTSPDRRPTSPAKLLPTGNVTPKEDTTQAR